jgi:hypothetical protein
MLAKVKRTWFASTVSVTGVVDIGEELAELEHRLARQDHFLALIFAGDPEARHDNRWPTVATRLQRPAIDDEQHSVQVVADVLLRHREFDGFQQPPQVALRERERLHLVLADADARIVRCRQRLQIESRSTCAKRHSAAGPVDRQRRVVGKRAQQILELSRGNRGCLRLFSPEIRTRGDLHFEVGRE